MRKKLAILSMLTTLSGSLKATDYTYLVFTLIDGTTQSIAATNLNLTFNDGNLTARSETSTLVIPLVNLQKMEFSNDGSTGINATNESLQNQPLTIDEATDFYDLQGRRVTKDQMRKGVYIIKKGNKSQKITIR